MTDNRTMEELLQEPTEGYGEAIVIQEINADHFEIKTNLLQLVQAKPYHGFERENSHTHINNFKRITSTLKFRDVTTDVIKLMMFPYSLEGTARVCNHSSVCAATGTYNQVAPQNRASNYMAPPGFAPVQNSSQNRFNQNRGQGNNFNRGNNFHGNQSFQIPNQGFQNQHFQVPNNQVQQGFSNEFLNYKKANDQMIRNMQSQINSLKGEFKIEIQNTMKTQQTVFMEQQNAFQNNLQNMLSGFFQNQSSTSGTLSSNTIPNPKGEIKAITTHSGVAYEGPSIPTNPFPKKISLPKLTPTRMTLELADQSITHPKGVTEDVFVKVGKFHLPTDFVVVDFEADPRVPLILRRSFLRTDLALIDVYGEEITLWLNDEAVSHIHCVPKKGGITVVENENNELIPTRLVTDTMLQRSEDTNLVLNWEKFHFMVKEGILPGHKISKNRLEVDRAKVNVILKLPHPTTVKGVRSFLGHAGLYRRFIQDFSKIGRPMIHLLEKETPFGFSKDCIDAFETLKKKFTKAPILVVLDWNLPFELMCDASDFTIGAVLGQRKTKHFQPIDYASKTMTEAQIHYTTTEKEMLAVVYAFEKFQPYLVLSKSIVYTDHSALKYLLSKQDAKPRLLRWVLLLQEFDIIIRDKKVTENLAADHLSRLENLHKDVFENKDINENFPLETLGKISSGSTPWFAHFANFHAGNFIVKGMSSQQKKKCFKDVKHY
uniref:RNA-directed DNA polymerase n=1 Tax=Tanacetum cinerariifolium TaxID=118510 RepID=A0A6L2NBZ8_TANCI|nr:reverse transcriptase domain-containing protein [Tanacetum cinerariifolium]